MAEVIDIDQLKNDTIQQTTPSSINDKATEYLLARGPGSELPENLPKDADWIKMAFVVNTDDNDQVLLSEQDFANRRYTSASLKYTDTSLGGNIVINPPPQFTRYADIRDKGFRYAANDTSGEVEITPSDQPSKSPIGMGRYYSEAIDDNNQIIHFRFGVAEYTSMTSFFTGFYSSEAASLARAGRYSEGFIGTILSGTGKAIGLAVAPLFIIPIAIIMFGTAARFLLNYPSSKFYSMRPTMPTYWHAVSGLLNQIGVNRGLIYPEENTTTKKIITGENISSANRENGLFASFLPDEYNENGSLNVYAIANKTKRMQMIYEENLKNAIDTIDVNAENQSEVLRKVLQNRSLLNKDNNVNGKSNAGLSLESFLKRYFDKAGAYAKQVVNNLEDTVSSGTEKSGRSNDGDPSKDFTPKTEAAGFINHLIANAADGSDWASFRVDYTGAVSESFSNSVAESSIASKINSISRGNREIRHNLSGGNVTGLLNNVTQGISSVIAGAASVLHVEGIAALAGSAFVDIPKHWDNSTARLPSASYTMRLGTPYGNPVSQMISIYLPLAMLLAGALPLATGKQSHTSPFLCELHDRGRCMTRLGIIDSLSITRGTSNLGFNNEGQAMAIDVSFTVLDLSSIVAMPISPKFSLMPLEGLFDSENAFSDYLMAMSGMSLGDTYYRLPMLKRQVKRIKANFNNYFSSAQMAMFAANLPGMNLVSALSRGTNRI